MNDNIFAILPLILIYDEKYEDLSMSAIILYSLFLNRTKYSLKNKKFIDDKGVFIYYSTEQISNHLHCSINSAKKVLSELEEIGLIRREYQKNGLPLKIYVNDIRCENGSTYSAYKQPQDKLSYKSHSYSNYNKKPHTDHSVKEEKQVSFDVERAEKIANDGFLDFSEMKIKKRRKHKQSTYQF